MKENYFIVGIDEAGRGPLAGPVAVGAVAMAISNDEFLIYKKIPTPNFKNLKTIALGRRTSKRADPLEDIKDSKKLTAKQREEWKKIIKENFEGHYVLISHKTIDKIGISKAIFKGVEKVLEKFSRKPDLVLMDGSLKAPENYNQKTIIKGDEKVPIISAASIIAKTVRDRKMASLHEKYPQYLFGVHKGYGTKDHREKIENLGLCEIHRKSFCKNIIKGLGKQQ